MDADAIIKALSALAQEHRLAAFRLLVQAGASGLPAGVLAALHEVLAPEARSLGAGERSDAFVACSSAVL